MRHALFDGGLQRVIVRIYIVDIGLNGGGKRVGLKECAAGVGVAMARSDRASGGFTNRKVCKADVGFPVARNEGSGVSTRNSSIVVLGFQDVERSRTNISRAHEKTRGQLALQGQVPLIDCRNVINAARVVRHGNLIERRNVGKVGGRRKWTRKFWIRSELRARAVQSRLRRRQSAKRIAEGTGRGAGSRRAVAGSGKNELRAKRPFIHEAVAQHAFRARVVKNSCSSAKTGFAVAEHVIGKANARSKMVQTGIQGVLRHPRVADAVLAREKDAWWRVGIYLGPDIRRHRREIHLGPPVAV